jgi:hypothetical protein
MDVLRDFWRRTFGITKIGLVGASVAALINIASYFGLSMTGPFVVLVAMHFLAMGLGFFLFARYTVHHRFAWRTLERPETDSPIPDRLIVAAILSGLYFALIMLFMVATTNVAQTEGIASRPEDLRVFSAAWTFFFLAIGLDGHRVERRIRAYRAMSRVAV